jgi:hypothetical protein
VQIRNSVSEFAGESHGVAAGQSAGHRHASPDELLAHRIQCRSSERGGGQRLAGRSRELPPSPIRCLIFSLVRVVVFVKSVPAGGCVAVGYSAAQTARVSSHIGPTAVAESDRSGTIKPGFIAV